MSDLAKEVRNSLQGFIEKHEVIKKLVAFIYFSLLWENFIGFGIIAAVDLFNYVIVFWITDWRVLPYIFFFILESYLLTKLLDLLFFSKITPEIAAIGVNAFLDEGEKKWASCTGCCGGESIFDKLPLKPELKNAAWFKPAAYSVGLLLLTLLSSMFSNGFVAFVIIFGLLIAPGFVHKGLDQTFKEKFWEPVVIPQYNKFLKPKVDDILAKLSGGQSSVSTREAPVLPPPPAAAPAAPAETGSSEPEESGESELNIDNLLTNIAAIGQGTDE